jgi:GxxExxY protein
MLDEIEFGHAQDSGVDAETEALARRVIGAAIEVHRIIGPGLPESVYRKALAHELELCGIGCAPEARVPVVYKGKTVGEGRVDILVDKRIVLELKTVDQISPVHRAQLIAYLQALRLRLGFLINFNVPMLKEGIKRVLNPHTI